MYTHKVVVIGDSGVGKSSLVSRYILNLNRQIPPTHDTTNTEQTIGAAHYMITINNIKLQVWDTAGQERFRSISPMYFRGSSGCICVFDITNRKSFENVNEWIRSFKEHASVRPRDTIKFRSSRSNNTSNEEEEEFEPNVLLVANKTDLNPLDWKVSIEEISIAAISLGCSFVLTSTFNMTNFEEFSQYIKFTYTNILPVNENLPWNSRQLGIMNSENMPVSKYSCIPNC